MSTTHDRRCRVGFTKVALRSLLLLGISVLVPSRAAAGWRQLGPGLRVEEVHVIDSFLFVCTSDGIYRGLRTGMTPNWTPIGLQGMSVASLAVLNRDTILAGMRAGAVALYRTTDGGANWEPIDSGFSDSGFRPVFDLASGGGPAATVYAATIGPDYTIAIERSTDFGESWNPLPITFPFGMMVFQFIHVDARFPGVIWAGGETGFFQPWMMRSYDSGASWEFAPIVATGDNRCHDVAIDPTDSNHVWVSMEGQVQESSDGGDTWAIVYESNHYLYSIVIDSLRPSRLYTSGGAPNHGLRYTFTTDGGAVWHDINGPSSAAAWCSDLDILSLADRSYVYFATTNGVLELLDPSVYLCGDATSDGEVTSSDVIFMVNEVFKSGPPPVPFPSVADVNCWGTVTGADIIALVNVVFKSGVFWCADCPSEVN